MGDLSIKNVPEKQIAVLKRRAKQNHRSLQGELRAIVAEVAGRSAELPTRMTFDEALTALRRTKLKTPSESVRMIREDRDAR